MSYGTHSNIGRAQSNRQNLILDGDFETGNLSQFGGKEALDHEIRIVTSPVRAGRFTARIEVNEDEYNQGGGRWRAELTDNGAGGANQERERWFGFSTYLRKDWENDSKTDIIFQIHERPDDCEDWRSPPLYLRVSGDRMQWQTRWDSNRCSNGNTPEGSAQVVSRPIIKGRWVDWVAHVKWSYQADGLIEIWQDGTKITARNGPNCYNDGREMYLKIGNYKLGWTDGITQRVHFIDEVRMGNSNAGYADVAPGGSAPTPTPTLGGTTIINEGFSQTSDLDYIRVYGGGVWQVTGGKLRLSDPASGSGIAGNSNLATYQRTIVPAGDFTLMSQASVAPTSSNWNDFSIVFGFVDINNYSYVSFNESNDAATSGVFRVTNGVTSELSDITRLITADTIYNVRVERRGDVIKAFLNDEAVASATSGGFTGSGYVGYGSRNDAATFDHLKVVR